MSIFGIVRVVANVGLMYVVVVVVVVLVIVVAIVVVF